jgi:hypothetical protein
MHSAKETLTVAWCDNGMVDGKFAEGLVYTIVTAYSKNILFNNAMRVQGNQIARQRQALIDKWYDEVKTDWILWVDSDIVLTLDVMKMIWDTADKHNKPIVSGVYFISKQNEGSLMQPMPVLFNETGDLHMMTYIHPLPQNQVIKIDNAGMGLVLMHRSVVTQLRAKFGADCFLFAEGESAGEKFIGEDVSFFRKVKEVGIPVYAHTGATVKHMKRFAFDSNYYNLYWAAVQHAEKQNGDTASEQ